MAVVRTRPARSPQERARARRSGVAGVAAAAAVHGLPIARATGEWLATYGPQLPQPWPTAARDALRAVLATGEPRTDIYRLRHRDGHYLWIEVAARSLPADDGGDRNDVVFAARNVDSRVAAEQALAESRLELERQSRVDALTGLANRRQLDERLDLALRRLHRQQSSLALLCMDIDRFKAINDGHGHAAGDAVLQAFARRLRDSVRETDLVARMGGDEFTILIEDAAPGAAETVAAKVLASTAAEIDADGTPLTVSTSIGIAYAREPTDAGTLMKAADRALYEAKQRGRNRYEVGAAP